MDKTKWLILGLLGMLLLVIAVPVEDLQEKKQEQAQQEALSLQSVTVNNPREYEKSLEQKLAQMLSEIEGVGSVQVMITFQDMGKAIVEKDVSRSLGQASYTEGQYQEETIYEESNGKQPYVSRQELPSVEGVLVVAQGAEDSMVKKSIQESVMALFPIEAHKIKIVKMNK